jgi:hypothetical protein
MTGLFLSLEEWLDLTPEEEAVECALSLLEATVEYELIPSISNSKGWKPHKKGRRKYEK